MSATAETKDRPRYPAGRATRKCCVCKTIVGVKTTKCCGRSTSPAFIYNA